MARRVVLLAVLAAVLTVPLHADAYVGGGRPWPGGRGRTVGGRVGGGGHRGAIAGAARGRHMQLGAAGAGAAVFVFPPSPGLAGEGGPLMTAGTAAPFVTAATADRIPLTESSIAAHCAGGCPSRLAASR